MMKTTLLAAILGIGFALGASASDKAGSASFTFWADNGGIASIDIWENSDGSIGGNSGFSDNGMFRLEAIENGWKGFADDGFVEATCTDGECEGQIGSGSFNITVSDEGTKYEGALNHVPVRATVSKDRIKVAADGDLDLRSDDGVRYSGSAVLRGFNHGSAALKLKGTMTDRLFADPVLFSTFLVAPFVRNGI